MPEALCSPKRVLVVDDDRNVADTITMVMRSNGFHAMACYSGAEAVECAAGFTPDVLITDYDLRACSGVEMALAVRREHPGCGVVILSGKTELSWISELIRDDRGRFVLLDKPVSPEVLVMQVGETLPTAA
jgi:DNA-binding response OmpR family regulator